MNKWIWIVLIFLCSLTFSQELKWNYLRDQFKEVSIKNKKLGSGKGEEVESLYVKQGLLPYFPEKRVNEVLSGVEKVFIFFYEKPAHIAILVKMKNAEQAKTFAKFEEQLLYKKDKIHKKYIKHSKYTKIKQGKILIARKETKISKVRDDSLTVVLTVINENFVLEANFINGHYPNGDIEKYVEDIEKKLVEVLNNRKITMLNLSVERVEFPRAKPVSISFHTWESRPGLIIQLHWREYQGVGEANPFIAITGDSEEQVLEQAQKLKNIDLDPEKHSLQDLHHLLQENTQCKTLQSAVDAAYHDLLGKIKQIPVHRLYSEKIYSPDNSVTVFLQKNDKETARETREILAAFPHLKILKIKLKGEGDIARARIIREIAPPELRFALDANQGFENPKQAVDQLSEIGEILRNVILVEEPCPKNDLKKLRYVKENLSNMLVFADESGATLHEVKQVAESQAAHGINIKLQKAGGIWPSRIIAKYCHENDLQIMVGAMIEGPIAIMTGIQFCACVPDILFCDLDTDLDLPKFSGYSSFERGKRALNNRPGLGVELSDDIRKKLTKSGDIKITRIM